MANFVQHKILEERDYLNDLLTHVVADLHRNILGEVKAMLDQALAMRIKGTFQPGTNYVRGDLVVRDGASFLARRDDPGPCPSANWQMVARQGARGIAGPKGERGLPGTTIVGWVVDRSTFTVLPLYGDGSPPGPPLELRALFEGDTT